MAYYAVTFASNTSDLRCTFYSIPARSAKQATNNAQGLLAIPAGWTKIEVIKEKDHE